MRFLCGNALGFNAEGVCFSVDCVRPRHLEVGLGRHFIARSLFDARSLDEAIQRTAIADHAAGFTYNIGSLNERRIVSVEVAPERHHVHEVRDHYLHTNHYLKLDDVDQRIGTSSRARLSRARERCETAAPATPSDVLALLGDQAQDLIHEEDRELFACAFESRLES